MTTILVDVVSVLGGRQSGVVEVWADPDRPAAGGGWVSGALCEAGIVDGHARLEPVAPGPAVLRVRLDGGMRYSRLAVVKHDNRTNDQGEGTVPDEEMAT